MCLFSNFQYVFTSFCSTADLLTVESHSIPRTFKIIFNLTLTFDISKTFDKVWRFGFLRKLKPCVISHWFFQHIFSFLSKRLIRVVRDDKFLPEFLVNADVLQSSILDPIPISDYLSMIFMTMLSISYIILYIFLYVLSMVVILLYTLRLISLLIYPNS